jgi:hypothetical protein
VNGYKISSNPDVFLGGRGVVYESLATNLWNPEQDFPFLPPPEAVPEPVHVFESRLKAEFVRGDVDFNGGFDTTDTVIILTALFQGAPAPECIDAADANDSGGVDISDPIYLLAFMFTGGGAPPSPFPGCGFDPTDDNLSCRRRGMTAGGICADDHSHD